VSDEYYKEKSEWGAGAAGGGGGGKDAIATAPPHQDLCDTHRKWQKWAQLAKPDGVLDLKTWFKLNLLKNIVRRAWTGLLKSFEKFKIASLGAKLQLYKLHQK
jgi:hypothetical protein